MRESGSLAVFEEVSFFFIPPILAQNDFLREPPSGCGAFNVPPVSRLYEARPKAFKPPDGLLPSERCHAGVVLPPSANILLLGIGFGIGFGV